MIVREAGGVVLQAGLCDNEGNALEDWKAAMLREEPVVYNKVRISGVLEVNDSLL